jgi:hypothetical protein
MKHGRLLWGGIGAIALAWLLFYAWQEHWYRGFIPRPIRTTGALGISGEAGLRGGCGVAIFRLSNETRDAIRTRGLAFLGPVRRAERTSYDPWQETPVRSELLVGMACANVGRSLSDAVYEGVSKPGSYVAMGRSSTLLVIPDSKLVVFSYMD